MKTYTFISNNTSLILTMKAESEEDAHQMLEEYIRPEVNDFYLDNPDDEDEEFETNRRTIGDLDDDV